MARGTVFPTGPPGRGGAWACVRPPPSLEGALECARGALGGAPQMPKYLVLKGKKNSRRLRRRKNIDVYPNFFLFVAF